MGFTVKHKKSSGTITRSFTYTGDLEKCIEDAEKELKKKTIAQEREFLRWQAERAKAALDRYEGRIDDNPCYKANRKITVKGLMLHSVGYPQPKASVFVNNWNKASYSNACVHAFIDANTGDIYQALPWNHRGWHCASKGFIAPGAYTIVEESTGQGAALWGKLKSGQGWIALGYTEKI